MRFLGKGWREVFPSVYELGVPVPLAVEADVEAVLGVFADPGPYSAFSNAMLASTTSWSTVWTDGSPTSSSRDMGSEEDRNRKPV